MPNAEENHELVLLTHGIASSKWLLAPIARRLRTRGFATELWSYPTLFRSVETHGRSLAERWQQRAASPNWDRVHLVVHSMGSIVARCALRHLAEQGDLPPKLGRVVMLGPPNGGSHMATFLKPIYGWVSTSLVQLCDTPDSFVNRLPPPPEGVDVGVLAARNDNVIHLEKTHLSGERDHRVVDSWHTGMLWKPETADMTASFLRHGRFDAAFDSQQSASEPACLTT